MSTVADRSIPLFDGRATPAMAQAALRILQSGQIAAGPLVGEFEARLAGRLGRDHVVCTDDMTSALTLSLRLACVQPGDDVLTLAFNCLSSNTPIALAGARPIWVDIDPMTAAMSVEDVRRALTPRTRALVLYHVAGHPGPADELATLCSERGLALIEDCNNALGAARHGQPVGRQGAYAVHSFYPNRQVNALDGGALCCPDDATRRRAIRLRRFGIDLSTFRDERGEINPSSDVPEIGWSASISQLHAAVGLSSLEDLDERLARVRAHARMLAEGLAGLEGLRVVRPIEGARPVYWGFLVLARDRDRRLAGLKRRGVQASILHQRNDTYSGFQATRRELPGTDEFMSQVMALPCGWWLDDVDIRAVIDAVREEVRA